MSAWLCGMPVPNAVALKGLIVSRNLEASVGRTAGTPCSASTNSGFVEGWLPVGGGSPRSCVVAPTSRSEPRLTREPSSGVASPAGGDSRLPALSVDKARNS